MIHDRCGLLQEPQSFKYQSVLGTFIGYGYKLNILGQFGAQFEIFVTNERVKNRLILEALWPL